MVVVVVRVEPIGVSIGADWLDGNGGGVGRTVGGPRVDWAHTTGAPEGRAEYFIGDQQSPLEIDQKWGKLYSFIS